MAQVASAESLQLKPRRYQQELFEDALRENVIAFLDTGSGKTLISVMLVKEKSRQLAPHLPLGAGRKVTVFLAPQVALVFQQTTVLRQHTDLRVGALCGEMGVDWWDAGRWQRQLAEHDVLVSTPQLAWVNLLCFDEAQHASKGHPYALLMKEFYFHLPPPDRPHIFGMTASPVNIRVTQSLDRIPMTIAELESTLNAKVMTVVDRSSVEAVAPPPEFIVREYTLPPPSLSIMAALQKLEAARAGLLLSAAQATQEAMLREQQVWGISAQDMACADGAAFDVTRFNSASARMARHIANVACTLQELGPWCAAAALSALLQPSTRNMYISGKREQQGADALGLADAPPMGLADAWLLPADALLPEGNSSVPRPDKKTGSESEHAALLEALRLATLAIAQLLVPDAAQLLSGLAEPSSTRAQLRAGLARCIAAVPAPLLDAHIMGTEAPPAEAAAAAAAATAAGGMLSNVTGGTSSAGAATTAAGDAAFSALMRSGSDTRQSHRSGAGGDVCSNGWHDTDDGTSCQNQAVPLKQQAAPPLQQRDYRLVTPKVTALAQTLLLYKDVALAQQPSRQSWSCIVFVTRKLAALAVDAVLRAAPGLGFLTAAPFMGYGGDTSAVSMDVKTQNATLERFKAGRLNTLVSTSVAEEGLDLKACQLVVRFDLPATPLAFVQSSGRARVLQSHMVLMLQAGNIEHIELLRSLRGYEDKMREEAALRRLDRLSVANAVDAATAAADDPEEEVPDDWWLLAGQPQEALEYCVPSTGAKVTLASAKQLVFHFCARLPSDRYAALRPRFVTEEGFVATVLLPNNSPVREVTGRLQMRRQLARASACLEACKLLHQAGALNDNLLPEARDYESGSQRKRKTSAAEQQEGESSDDEDLPAKQAKQAALPPFELQHHVPAALRLCSPAALEEAVMREDTTKFRSSTKMLHFYALSRQLAPGVTARVADEMELSRQLGLALLAPLPLLPDFTSQLSSGTEVQVRVLDLGSRELPLADVGRLQMYHRAMLHPDSLHGEAGATGSADAEDGAAAASTRRRIIRRQTAKAASAAVAAPAAELAAAAGLSGTDLAPALAPAVKLPAPTYTMPVAAAVGPGSSASTASSLARAQQHGSSWSEPGSLLAAMMAAAAGDCCASQPILQPGPQPTGVTAADGQPSGATKAAGPQNAEAQIAMPPPGRASPAQQQQAGTDTRRGTPDVAGDAPRQGVCPGGAAAAPTGESAATPPDGTSAAAPAPLAVPVPAIAAAAPAAGAVLPAAPVAGGAPGIDLSDAIGKPLDCRYVSDARWAAPLTGAWYILVPLTSAEPAAAAATTAAAAAAATATAKPAQPQMSPATEAAAGPCKAQHSQQRCTGKRAQHGVAPSATQLAEGSMPVPQALHVDWAAIKAVAQGYQEMPPELVTTGEPTAAALQALRGAVLATRYNSWRYVADDLHGSLMVDSAMPADRARAATAAREGPPPKMRKADSGAAVPAGERTFREYYRERWGEGELVPQRLLLARHASRRAAADAQAAAEAAAEGATGSAAASSAEVYLVPQLCLVHPLPRAAHSAARGVPRLMWWLGGLLTAQELLAELAPAQLPRALWPRPETVLEALTGTACQEAFSYERMEMLGDAVLKFVTCDRLFELHPGAHEGRLALRKDAVVSNVALALAGQRLRLQDRLTTPFQVKLGVAAPGSPAALAKRKEDPTVRILRAKVLADVIEALTGAFFLSGGLHAATAWLTSIGVLPPPPTAPPVRPSPPAEVSLWSFQADGRQQHAAR